MSNDLVFRLFGLILIVMTLMSIAGTIFLIYRKLKKNTRPGSKAILVWWAIEASCVVLVLILIYRYAILPSTDKRSQGLLTYMMTIWFLPILICGAIGIFVKPTRSS